MVKVYHYIFVLNNVEVKTVEKKKYFCVFVTEGLTDDVDMARHRKYIYIYSTGNTLIRQFKFCSHVKTVLFKTHCSNMYSCHLWLEFLTSTNNKLKVDYSCICRYFMKLGRMDSTLSEVIRTCLYVFYVRLSVCENGVINTIFKLTFLTQSILSAS